MWPTFISCAENSIQMLFGLLRKLHLVIMNQSAHVCEDECVTGAKCVCVLVHMHSVGVCMFVHLLTCIRAIKALLLDSSPKPLKLK